jgi:hypothetical protein
MKERPFAFLVVFTLLAGACEGPDPESYYIALTRRTASLLRTHGGDPRTATDLAEELMDENREILADIKEKLKRLEPAKAFEAFRRIAEEHRKLAEILGQNEKLSENEAIRRIYRWLAP